MTDLLSSSLLILAEAEAQNASASIRHAADAIGAAQVPGAVVPTAAPNHTIGTTFWTAGVHVR
jgi:hypothetical protein